MIKQLDTETILIYWKQRSWKTLLSVLLSYDYLRRIYWNMSIYAWYLNEENKWFDVVKKITKVTDFNNFFKIWKKENYTPWVCIIDEIWMNFNSKEWTSKKNMIFSKFLWLQWKFNLSWIYISQRLNSIPVDFRELASVIFEVKKIPQKKENYPFLIFCIKDSSEMKAKLKL